MNKSLAERIVDRIAAEGKFMVIDAAHVEHILDVADAIFGELEDAHAELGIHADIPAAIELPEPASATLADLAIGLDDDKAPIANDVVAPVVEEPAAPAPKRRR